MGLIEPMQGLWPDIVKLSASEKRGFTGSAFKTRRSGATYFVCRAVIILNHLAVTFQTPAESNFSATDLGVNIRHM